MLSDRLTVFGYTRILGLFSRTKFSLGTSISVWCIMQLHRLGDRCSAIWYLFLCIALFSFFESSAILTDLSFFTVITTGLTNKSSGHFLCLLICLFCISLSNSSSTFSSKCTGTLRPFCWFGVWFCLNIDLVMWFFDFPILVHRWGYFFVDPFHYVLFDCNSGYRINFVTWGLVFSLLQEDSQFLHYISSHRAVCFVSNYQVSAILSGPRSWLEGETQFPFDLYVVVKTSIFCLTCIWLELCPRIVL